ncbi:class I SAM-dependent methyltransferase [Cohnella sp. REN36]|uniref:class I SAM-dependent methyltransferase n=1 Tax=Cohnella sp. REN36 TaxID=2887347 RepID=UPI001D139C6E|nr:class I SAM-dependent methyltransferase [Cohnella sp. REN36]MCC3375049.1 class I SAM-dependent methyltransferase [Cohnella sp. REN36]
MSDIDYRAFYDRVGRANGWDFSRVQVHVEGSSPDLYEEARGIARSSDLLLDIGTGGGEALLGIRDAVHLLVGIDRSADMICTAASNLARTGATNVRFVRMDAERLAFPDRFFDIATSRHAPFDAAEVARVVADEGVFLTQQVGEGDKANLKAAFGRGQCYGVPEGTLLLEYTRRLSEAGFTELETSEYDAIEYYRTPEDLLFLLKHTPIIPDFGKAPGDFEKFDRFVREQGCDQGVRTNARRFVIRARKRTS